MLYAKVIIVINEYFSFESLVRDSGGFMSKDYNMKVDEILFQLSDVYNQTECEFDHNIGEILFGKLLFHRVVNIAYKNLLRQTHINLGEFDRYFKMHFEQGCIENHRYKEELMHVCDVMDGAEFPYAFLKGAILITNVYGEGLRYSNDIDILINESDIDACQELLLENGFIQGEVENGKIHEASRRDIVLSRMNYGETVPFFKEYNNRFICVDINFSLDYKPSQGSNLIGTMLSNRTKIEWGEIQLPTLDIIDFIIHLCMHLYKEATTIDWVIRRKDLNLYKFSDLNVVFHELATEDIYMRLYENIVKYGVEKECYYALFYTGKIYKNLMSYELYDKLLNKIKPKDIKYLRQIIDPQNKKIYMREMGFREWFACNEREKYLIEYNDERA